MKHTTRNIFVTAALSCAAIFFVLAPAPAVGSENVFQGFANPSDPMDWSGFYAGFNNGAGFNHFHTDKHMTDVNLEEQYYDLFPEVTGVPSGSNIATFDSSGLSHTKNEAIGGAQTGFNFQLGHFVFGAEGSFIGNGNTAGGKSHEFQENPLFLDDTQPAGLLMPNPHASLNGGNITADTEFTSKQKIETTWNGFVGGQLGFAWNRFLFYGTGGVAFTDVHFDSWDRADTSFFSECEDDCEQISNAAAPRVRSGVGPHQGEFFIGEIVNTKKHDQGDVLTGWYGGGGIAYALTNIVSVGLEYKHIDWGDVTEHLTTGNGPVFPGNTKVDLSGDQVVFKVDIMLGHFNPFH